MKIENYPRSCKAALQKATSNKPLLTREGEVNAKSEDLPITIHSWLSGEKQVM